MAIKFRGLPRGIFLDDERWNSKDETVDFTLLITDDEGEKPIVCRVSYEALADALGASRINPVEVYRGLKSKAHKAIDRKLKAGEFEPDDSILVRTADLNR